MTGGQYSPTTPHEKIASTSPYGNVENSFDIVNLALASGATYVARSTVFHYAQMVQFIQRALDHKGMAVVEIMTNCHTYYGRYNAMSQPEDMLAYFKKNTVQINKARTMSPEELADKIVAGEFVNKNADTYSDSYRKKIEELMKAERGDNG
jgi:2-oxoglutarate ferredoxin oxidoreductase subunit beta